MLGIKSPFLDQIGIGMEVDEAQEADEVGGPLESSLSSFHNAKEEPEGDEEGDGEEDEEDEEENQAKKNAKKNAAKANEKQAHA